MNWVQVVLLIMSLLRSLQQSETAEAFCSSSAAARIGADRELLNWLWENREQIIAFILQLVEMFQGKPELFGEMIREELQ